MSYVYLIIGFLLLVIGGDTLVRGAVAIAKQFNVSTLLIGLILVGFGTSTPELVTSVQAAFAGAPGIAIGNVVGSNIANILLILALAGLIHPLTTSREALFRDGSVMMFSTLCCVAVIMAGTLARGSGLAFIALLGLYIVCTYRRERNTVDASAEMHAAGASSLSLGRHGSRFRAV